MTMLRWSHGGSNGANGRSAEFLQVRVERADLVPTKPLWTAKDHDSAHLRAILALGAGGRIALALWMVAWALFGVALLGQRERR
jgi:hypothetical protein